MDLFNFIQAMTGILATVFAFITFKITTQKKELEKTILDLKSEKSKIDTELNTLKNWAKNVASSSSDILDVIVLGPRQAGKTSVVESWFKPWNNVHSSKPTENWHEHKCFLCNFDDGTFYDEKINVERKKRKQLVLRVRDYAGEDSYRIKAFDYIASLESNVVIVLFITPDFTASGIVCNNENNSYYSASVLKELELYILTKNIQIRGVAVVFNKIDLASPSLSENDVENICIKEHTNILERINSIFGGKVSIYFTSATKNTGVINLLRDICWTMITEDGQKKKVASFLKKRK